MGDLGEFVECQTCRVTYRPEVLTLKPLKPQVNPVQLLNSAKANLEGGQPVEYVTRDLVAAGIERELVLNIIKNSIGEGRKICKPCGLSYAPNVETCVECKQPLTETSG